MLIKWLISESLLQLIFKSDANIPSEKQVDCQIFLKILLINFTSHVTKGYLIFIYFHIIFIHL